MDSTVKYLRVLAKEKSLQLHCECSASETSWVHGDDAKLRQILVNLISNAIKFTRAGQVTVSVEQVRLPDDRVQLRCKVADTGIGIREEDLPKIFQEFLQLHEFGSIPSTGLGLVIAKQLVELMEGSLWVESVFGKGSVFQFTVTLEGCEKAQGCNPVKRKLEWDSSLAIEFPLEILVAEDNPLNRKLIAKILSQLGYTNAVYANDGIEVLEKLQGRHVDLILMVPSENAQPPQDIHMPRMNGIEAAQKIIESYPKPPKIFALSASSWESDLETYQKVGMDGFLSKPLQIPQLIDVIVNCRKMKSKKY